VDLGVKNNHHNSTCAMPRERGQRARAHRASRRTVAVVASCVVVAACLAGARVARAIADDGALGADDSGLAFEDDGLDALGAFGGDDDEASDEMASSSTDDAGFVGFAGDGEMQVGSDLADATRDADASGASWEKFRDTRGGKEYYFDSRTQKSQWEVPDGFVELATGETTQVMMDALGQENVGARLEAAVEAARVESKRLRVEEERLAAEEARTAMERQHQMEAQRLAEEEARAEQERLRLEAEAAAEQERLRLEAEAAAEQERLRLEAEAAAEAARVESERQRIEAERLAAEEARAEMERQQQMEAQRRAEEEVRAEQERLRLEAEAAAEAARVESERQRIEAERLAAEEARAETERQRLAREAAQQAHSQEANYVSSTTTDSRPPTDTAPPKATSGQKVLVPPTASTDEALRILREWLVANRIPVKSDTSPADTITAVTNTLLRSGKAIKAMKKTEQELRQALNTQVPVPGGAQVNEVELQTRIATLEADLAQAADAVDVEKQKRKNLESDHEMIRVEYDRLVHSVASKSTVAKLEHTISELTDKLETSEAALAKMTADFTGMESAMSSAEDVAAHLGECTAQLVNAQALTKEVDELRVALQAARDAAPNVEASECTCGEAECRPECSRSLEKLRNNLQKQADALRQRTFDAEVQFEEQKERCDQIERKYSETKKALAEERDNHADTLETLAGERATVAARLAAARSKDRHETKASEETIADEVESESDTMPDPTETVDKQSVDIVTNEEATVIETDETIESNVAVETDVAAVVDDAPSDAKDSDVIKAGEDVETVEPNVSDEGEDSVFPEPHTEKMIDNSSDVEIEEVERLQRNLLEWEPLNQIETADTGVTRDDDDALEDIQELGDFSALTNRTSGFSSIKTGLGYVTTFIKPPLMFVIRLLSTVMDAMLQRAWGSRHGNQLSSFMERCDKTLTAVATRIDKLTGTSFSNNADLIAFGVNAFILGPPIVLTLVLMRLVSALFSGGRKKPSTHGKWKGAPPPSTARVESTHAYPSQQNTQEIGNNPQVGMAPPPMMMAPPAGGVGSGIPSPATSPRDTPQYPTPFSNPYAMHSGGQQPPHVSSNLPPGPPRVNTGAPSVLSNASNIDMARVMSLTEPMEPIDDMSNDIPDSEAAGSNFVMMGNPMMGNPSATSPRFQVPLPMQPSAPAPASAPPAPPSAPPAPAPRAAMPAPPPVVGGRGPPPGIGGRGPPPPGRGYPGRGPPGGGRGRGPPPPGGGRGRGPPPSALAQPFMPQRRGNDAA
jgi:hypothetical protein